MTEHDTLFFPERRIDGAFPVTDAHGNPVARVTATWSGGRFSVTTVDGGPLCEGATSRWWLSGKWQVTDADGRAAAHGDGQAAAQLGGRAPRARR